MDLHLKNLNLCDFCCSPIGGFFKIYPCRTFRCRIDPTFIAVGEWQGCVRCVELIDTEQWTALEDRCVAAMMYSGMFNDAYTRKLVRTRHRQFRENRELDRRLD